MKIRFEVLTQKNQDKYNIFLERASNSLFYHSIKYKNFLESALTNSSSHYILGLQGDEVIIALPLFLVHQERGKVINSLPFFGSHGSIISLSEVDIDAKKLILKEFIRICENEQVLSATIIENFNQNDRELLTSIGPDYVDSRISQITYLPKVEIGSLIVDPKKLLALFHSKTRNAIRKGLKSELIFSRESSGKIFRELYYIHSENMEKIGGNKKSLEVLELIPLIFDSSSDFDIFTARNSEGILVSALLVFYFKDWVEYFMPATKLDFRDKQPMSALIFQAMTYAIENRQSKYWNWGGTWISQEGVKNFKQRWGAQETVYHYYTKMFSHVNILNSFNRNELAELFPFYYVIPFSEFDRQK